MSRPSPHQCPARGLPPQSRTVETSPATSSLEAPNERAFLTEDGGRSRSRSHPRLSAGPLQEREHTRLQIWTCPQSERLDRALETLLVPLCRDTMTDSQNYPRILGSLGLLVVNLAGIILVVDLVAVVKGFRIWI